MATCKIIIIQLGRIGDAVLATPMIKAISNEIPGAEIYLLVSLRSLPVFDDNPRIKKIFLYKKSLLQIFRLIIRLRMIKFDYWIDPKDHYSRTSALLAKICKATIKVGFNRNKKVVFDIGISSDGENFEKTALERNLEVLQKAKLISSANYTLELFTSPYLEIEIKKDIASWVNKTILFNISAGHISRYWEVNKWAALATFCNSLSYRTVIVFKPQDIGMAKKIHQLQPGVILFPTQSIKEIIVLMPKVQLVITPDTSAVHIASAFNIPQIDLFPAVTWNFNKFRPLSSRNIVIQPEKGALIKTISEKEVISAVKKYLLDELVPCL